MRTVCAYKEDEILDVAGWDAVVYCRILRFGEYPLPVALEMTVVIVTTLRVVVGPSCMAVTKPSMIASAAS